MVYHLFQNLFGNGPKKDKMSDQNPRGAETKFPQCMHCMFFFLFTVFKKYLTRPDTSDSGVDTCENEESTSGSGSLFIDRLDEETIKRVSNKLEGGERDLFAPCVKDVKALLSKEPFQEFLK